MAASAMGAGRVQQPCRGQALLAQPGQGCEGRHWAPEQTELMAGVPTLQARVSSAVCSDVRRPRLQPGGFATSALKPGCGLLSISARLGMQTL